MVLWASGEQWRPLLLLMLKSESNMYDNSLISSLSWENDIQVVPLSGDKSPYIL